jgi:hypothetical protein
MAHDRPFGAQLPGELIEEIESYPMRGLCYHPPWAVFENTGVQPFYRSQSQ